MTKARGFSLIELLIVVAVIGILSSIAIPAYNDYVRRGKITEAIALLADYRVKLEQYYQDNRNYGTAGGSCGVAVPASKYFSITCTAGNPAQTYTATAASLTRQGLGANGGDYTYTIDQSNSKATTKFKGVAVDKTCWAVKGDEC